MEGQCFGLVSHSHHVWEGGEGSLQRTKSSKRAKSTRFLPVKEEIATLVVNKTSASPQLCGRPRESRLGASASSGVWACVSVYLCFPFGVVATATCT